LHWKGRRRAGRSIPARRKGGMEMFEPLGGKQHGAACAVAPGPAQGFDAGKQGAAKAAGQMRAALAPVEAFAAKRAARATERDKIDAEGFEERNPLWRDAQTIGREFEHLPGAKAFEHLHAQIARQMIVADPRGAQ